MSKGDYIWIYFRFGWVVVHVLGGGGSGGYILAGGGWWWVVT